jgi:hypothetical protein
MAFVVNAITISTGSYLGRNLFSAQVMPDWMPYRKTNCIVLLPVS